jgi:hypothetical protein
MWQSPGRRQVLKERASKLSRSVCESFAFAATETVSITSGNRLLQAVGNHGFNPYAIPYTTWPTMSRAGLQIMLPETSGEVHVVSFHESTS